MKDNFEINPNSKNPTGQKLENELQKCEPHKEDNILTYYAKGFKYHLEEMRQNWKYNRGFYNDMFLCTGLAIINSGFTYMNFSRSDTLLTIISGSSATALGLTTIKIALNLKNSYPKFREYYPRKKII